MIIHNLSPKYPPITSANFSFNKTGHEWVDLGLSVKWATCNVGASSPNQYGDFFAWGETSPKEDYLMETYRYGSIKKKLFGIKIEMLKYNDNDCKTMLDIIDDTAQTNWGGRWRMPSIEDFKELITMCKWSWIEKGRNSGYEVTGPNGNSIFLPAAGIRCGSFHDHAEGNGFYWSSSLKDICFAWGLNFWSDGEAGTKTIDDDMFSPMDDDRSDGMTVRPVIE